MKANELMIGGLCRRRLIYQDTGREVVTDFKISQICKNGENLYVYGPKGNMGRVDQIEPIPLTAEILEKNGWKHDPSVSAVMTKSSYSLSNDIRRSWDSRNHKLYLAILNERESREINIPCHYVHELQQALRLCGIEKEIE